MAKAALPVHVMGNSGQAMTQRSLLMVIFFISVITTLVSNLSMNFIPMLRNLTDVRTSGVPSVRPNGVEGLVMMRANLDSWVAHLLAIGPDGTSIRTNRTACREMEAGAQTCVFDGLACIDINNSSTSTRPLVYLVDDTQPHNSTVPSDRWCSLRHQSADPRYFSTRHWPILNDTVAPQQSCLDARYVKSADLLQGHFKPSEKQAPRVQWLPTISLIDLDYLDNSHNNHLVKDIIWLLDISLFQTSLTGVQDNSSIFPPHRHIYLPQTRVNFMAQTKRDVNRLTYSLILRKPLDRLYAGHNREDMKTPQRKRGTMDLMKAHPELDSGQLHFHLDKKSAQEHDLVCTSRLTVGAKIGNGAHERVCREMRSRSYELFGIKRPPVVRRGQINYPQPEKSILVLNRHITRKIGNVDEVVAELRLRFEPLGIPVRLETTELLGTAEDFVRVYSSAGVIVTPHGSHNMGLFWMHRFRYVLVLKLCVFSSVFLFPSCALCCGF